MVILLTNSQRQGILRKSSKNGDHTNFYLKTRLAGNFHWLFGSKQLGMFGEM